MSWVKLIYETPTSSAGEYECLTIFMGKSSAQTQDKILNIYGVDNYGVDNLRFTNLVSYFEKNNKPWSNALLACVGWKTTKLKAWVIFPIIKGKLGNQTVIFTKGEIIVSLATLGTNGSTLQVLVLWTKLVLTVVRKVIPCSFVGSHMSREQKSTRYLRLILRLRTPLLKGYLRLNCLTNLLAPTCMHSVMGGSSEACAPCQRVVRISQDIRDKG